MEIRDLLSKPVWQMTGEEFIFLNRHALQGSGTKPAQPAADKDKKYVYGIGGIARLFGCSIPTANRIKKSGRIDRAITQIGRCGMDNKERNITPEEAVILWQASRLDLSEDYEKAPEILKVRGSGEFQRVNRKSQEQEDVQRLRNRGGCAEKRDGTKLHG